MRITPCFTRSFKKSNWGDWQRSTQVVICFVVWGSCVPEKTGLQKVKEKTAAKTTLWRVTGKTDRTPADACTCRCSLRFSPKNKHAHRRPCTQLKTPSTKKYTRTNPTNTTSQSLRHAPCRLQAAVWKHAWWEVNGAD